MSTLIGVLGFAVLFGGFALMAPVLARKRCDGGGCSSCSSSTECKYAGE